MSHVNVTHGLTMHSEFIIIDVIINNEPSTLERNMIVIALNNNNYRIEKSH